jgi:thiol:disulfide interchange protein DsbD
MKKFLFVLSIFLLSQSFFVHAQESIFDTSSTLFSNEDEFLKVDEAFVFDFFQQKQKLTISFNIKDGYYLYRKQFKFTADNAEIIPIVLPNGIEHNDEFFGLQQIYNTPLTLTINLLDVQENASISIHYQGCAKKGLCYPPVVKKIPLTKTANSTSANILNALTPTSSSQNQPIESQQSSVDEQKSEQFELADMLAGDNLLLTLLAFFVGGLLLSFTPCVFPMYPILTGIIVGQGENLSTKRAFSLSFFYVQGMAITYTILGIVVALAGAQFQAMFQHPIVLIVLSILFIFLALSMFGVFNLALPSSWQNKLNNISNKQEGGSYFGVVVMGAISGLVASPCTTAPLTGALIFIADSGDIVTGATALYALSLGMGLPLLVLGSSGGKLLPKAGNWMNIIKNVFGLLLFAVPIFLLERFIPALVSEGLWAILLLASASYFYVANASSHKNFFYGVRSLVIFLMLFWGANTLYQIVYPTQTNVVTSTTVKTTNEFVHVKSLSELKQAIQEANDNGKTVMVDLYADWCIACKEFEEYTFPDSKVQAALHNTLLVQVDLTNTGSKSSIELMEKFEVFGLPSILFFDRQGQELGNKRVTGFMVADDFTKHLKTFL